MITEESMENVPNVLKLYTMYFLNGGMPWNMF